MVNLEIVQKRENALLKRTEVTFKVTHPKEKTPQRGAIRDKIAATVTGKKEGVVIAWMRSRYGSPTTMGYAKVYETPEAAKATEPNHVLVRNGLAEKKKKAAAAAPAAKAPEKKK